MIPYPRIPRDKKIGVKIKTTDIPNIIHLHETGVSDKQIAEMYHVSTKCIHYHVDPVYREKALKKSAEANRARYRDDPNEKIRIRKRNRANQQARRERDPIYKLWHLDQSRIDYERHAEQRRRRYALYYQDHKEVHNAKRKERWWNYTMSRSYTGMRGRGSVNRITKESKT